jgi:hypothetical protein
MKTKKSVLITMALFALLIGNVYAVGAADTLMALSGRWKARWQHLKK